MSHPGSLAFRACRPGMIWYANFQTHEEPTRNQRELAMSFFIGTTTAYELTEGQRRFLLGQAIDFNILVWIVGICSSASS